MSELEARLAEALDGRYRIDRLVGEGGMALVYSAQDLRHGRSVAIKVLRPELTAEIGSERFLREIEIAARLRHPHILPLYDSGTAGGVFYYVMPFVEGESLRARIQRERQLPIEDALRYAREVADALSYAHAHGIVHRDIKPENILIESDHAVIADFGIAKAIAAAGRATGMTGTGLAIGTPVYMSPEQATAGADVDGRSDLYSLACVTYEMLAGQPPFTGVTTEALVRQHLMASPPAVTQFRPAVPAAVNDALMRALSKVPADRFNPVGQFSAALAPGAGAPAPGGDTPRSRRIRPAIATALLAVLLAAAGVTWAIATRRDAVEMQDARSVAVLPFDNLSGDTAIMPLILGVHTEIVTQLAKVDELTVATRNAALAYRGSTKRDREIATELGVASLVRGSIQRAGNQVRFTVSLADAPRGKQLWAESYDREYTAANLFEVQGDIARQVATALRVRLSERQQRELTRAPTNNLDALDAYYRGLVLWDARGPSGEDSLGVSHFERAVALDSSFAAAWGMLASMRSWLLRRSLARDTLPALRALERVRALSPGSLESALAAGYYRYYAHGDFPGALREMSAAERLAPKSGDVLYVMALLERRVGNWARAEALMLRALESAPRDVSMLSDLSEIFRLQRRFDDAERILDRAAAIEPSSARIALLRFRGFMNSGDTAGARVFLQGSGHHVPSRIRALLGAELAMVSRDQERAMSGYQSQLTQFGGGAQYRSLTLAIVAAAFGDSATARIHADSMIREARAELAKRDVGVDPFHARAQVESQIAVAMAIRGEREPAVRLGEASVGEFGPEQDAVDGIVTLNNLALTYTIAGRRAEAVSALRRALTTPGSMTRAFLALDPRWDSLRSDPGFQQLLAAPD